VYFVVDKKVLGELGFLLSASHHRCTVPLGFFCQRRTTAASCSWVSSVSVAPPLHRALASGTANIMQSWELTALLNDNLKSQKDG
jgi:hypothetical protein